MQVRLNPGRMVRSGLKVGAIFGLIVMFKVVDCCTLARSRCKGICRCSGRCSIDRCRAPGSCNAVGGCCGSVGAVPFWQSGPIGLNGGVTTGMIVDDHRYYPSTLACRRCEGISGCSDRSSTDRRRTPGSGNAIGGCCRNAGAALFWQSGPICVKAGVTWL